MTSPPSRRKAWPSSSPRARRCRALWTGFASVSQREPARDRRQLVMDHDRVGDFVVPTLFAGIESDPYPSDVAGQAIDYRHEKANRRPTVTDRSSGVRVNDPE